ncbi:MAG: ankyrin repeat domain-containing protein [Acidobacteria bacterium]|nr:ankyrin repeat domain-containing protein [Acidobacteriota bacterium]
MTVRRLPVRPNLEQLQRQAKEFLEAIRAEVPEALADLREYHSKEIDPTDAKLADAQLVLARSYQASSWPRLVQSVRLAEAIWGDDLDIVREVIALNPALVNEDVLIRTDSNWGPPLTYAANLGRDRIIRFLHEQGGRDLRSAIHRAVLHGKARTVRLINELAGGPPIDRSALAGAAYTLSVDGTAIIFELGVRVDGPNGVDTNTMEHILGTDARIPERKHRILEMYVEHGFEPPDTPVMALHRGRVDLLEDHLRRDPELLTRTFDRESIYPLNRANLKEPYMAQGTPVHGTTLLHIAAYFDEVEIGEWLIEQGMDPDVRSAIDEDGFGGYTALFSTVVSQRNFWVNYGQGEPDLARFTRLLLDHDADPNVRASLCHRLDQGHGGGPLREYHDVTPLGWGEQFYDRIFVSKESMRLISERGGVV